MSDAPAPPIDPEPGRFAYEGLERAIHEKARLGIMTSLATHSAGLSFNDLKGLCQLTDGNLSRHLQVLQDEGLVEVRKDAAPRRPQTRARLTDEGRRRFLDYLATLERVVADALSVARAHPEAEPEPGLGPSSTQGWSTA